MTPASDDERRRAVLQIRQPDPPMGRVEHLQGSMVDHPARTTLLALGSIGLLGLIDWATGSEISFSAFYLLPVTAVAWSNGRRRWLTISLLSAFTWLIADLTAGQDYSNRLIPIWNTTMRFGVFVLVGALFAQLRVTVAAEKQISAVDHLTGVLNSREFHRRAAEVVAHLDRSQLTVMFFDLDDFKAVNDERGHSGGDDALREVGVALRAAMREVDLIGRLGGDEFALMFVLDQDADAASVVAQVLSRVRATLASLDASVSFSTGAVTFATAPTSVDLALDEADRLMYEVKRTGKGAVLHKTVTVSGVLQP